MNFQVMFGFLQLILHKLGNGNGYLQICPWPSQIGTTINQRRIMNIAPSLQNVNGKTFRVLIGLYLFVNIQSEIYLTIKSNLVKLFLVQCMGIGNKVNILWIQWIIIWTYTLNQINDYINVSSYFNALWYDNHLLSIIRYRTSRFYWTMNKIESLVVFSSYEMVFRSSFGIVQRFTIALLFTIRTCKIIR